MALGLCLAGPTASGKTAVALALARELPLEVISVDSALVYRGMDIGTAKPTAAERAAVPHHLIDLVAPTEAYSAARFVADATRIAADVRARGRLPLLVGGTMLYFRALRQGLDAMPAADPVLRAALDARAASEGWPALHAELARVDPATAARLAPHDRQRVQRALEVWQLTGRPMSQWQRGATTGSDQADDHHGIGARTSAGGEGAARPDEAPGSTAWPLVALEPASRAWLHARITERFDAMLGAGFVDEVRALRARADLHPGLPSMRCVGYRQVWVALDAGVVSARATPQAWDAMRDAAIAATRQLAKRQLTWLRSMPGREVVACDGPDALAQALARLRRLAGA